MFCLCESQQGTSTICVREKGEKWAKVTHLRVVFLWGRLENIAFVSNEKEICISRDEVLREGNHGDHRTRSLLSVFLFSPYAQWSEKSVPVLIHGKKIERWRPRHALCCCTVQTVLREQSGAVR